MTEHKPVYGEEPIKIRFSAVCSLSPAEILAGGERLDAPGDKINPEVRARVSAQCNLNAFGFVPWPIKTLHYIVARYRKPNGDNVGQVWLIWAGDSTFAPLLILTDVPGHEGQAAWGIADAMTRANYAAYVSSGKEQSIKDWQETRDRLGWSWND